MLFQVLFQLIEWFYAILVVFFLWACFMGGIVLPIVERIRHREMEECDPKANYEDNDQDRFDYETKGVT